MGLLSFLHYDEPSRAQKVFSEYVPNLDNLILTKQDEVTDAVRDNNTADGLDLALNEILADHERTIEDIDCFGGFQNK